MKKLISLLVLHILFCCMDRDASVFSKNTDEVLKNNFRSNCAQPISQTELNINNVRATLLNAGDLWWDLQNGGYVVPKSLGVRSIFAAGVWMGGFDPMGNLKVAAQTFRRATRNDYWSGPLDNSGEIDPVTCANWDRFFEVRGTEVRDHIVAHKASVEQGSSYTDADIPASILSWPAKGNPHFFEMHGFHLPEDRGVTAFYDYNKDGIYNPEDGDYPVLKRNAVHNGEDHYLIPDQMISWVFNDNGGIHTSSNGFPLQMEVQATAFAFISEDEMNDHTFQQFRLLSFSPDDIEQFHTALFIAPQFGCGVNDYFGVDTTTNMMYIYKQTEMDGSVDCWCYSIPNFCDNIPILGIRVFDGLKSVDTLTGNTADLGLTSFIYFNNPSVGTSPPGTTDPRTAMEFYRYMTGKWRDGSRIAPYGPGYDPNYTGSPSNYTFYSNPSDHSANAWSRCSEDLPFGDRRLVVGSGPITLSPGAVNEIMLGNIFIPSQKHPCPSIKPLQFAAEMAEVFLFDQAIHDGIFPEGPHPPDLIVDEWSEYITISLRNDVSSNNYLEQYAQPIPSAAAIRGEETELYRFEGYRVFQVVHDSVQAHDLNNPNLAVEVFQCDIDNDVSSIFNWKRNYEDPVLPAFFYSELMVNGQNKGIEHSFTLKIDAFTGERFHRKKAYHFVALAYAWNNYAEVDPETGIGQRKPYLPGSISRLKVYDAEAKGNASKLYPTLLTSGERNLWIENVSRQKSMLLLDKNGKLITSWNVPEHNERLSLMLPADLSPGLYFIQIVNEDQRAEILRFVLF